MGDSNATQTYSSTGSSTKKSLSVEELTKDLVQDERIASNTSHQHHENALDFGMESNVDEADHDDDRTVGLTDDEDDRTVAMSLVDEREHEEGMDLTDDDRTVAMSVGSVEKEANESDCDNGKPENEDTSVISSPLSKKSPPSTPESVEKEASEKEDTSVLSSPLSQKVLPSTPESFEKEASEKEDASVLSSPLSQKSLPATPTEPSDTVDADDGAESDTSNDAPTPPRTKNSSLRNSKASPVLQTPRRSTRARKPRVLYSAERKAPKVKDQVKASKFSQEEWIASTDVLFVQTEDKSSVTVKQIFVALEEKFDCKISKALKKVVRERLKALITGKVKPSCDQESNSEASDDEESEQESDDASTYSEEERPKRKTRRNRRAAARAASKVVEAHKLRRKKRLEELKVRNEEMQLDQTKEDEERSEAIASKFETNTEQMRLQRLEDRLDLLQRLDATRISVVAAEDSHPPSKPEEETEVKAEEPDEAASESGEDDDSSSDEEDLVIVGMKKSFKPLPSLHNSLPSKGLQLLKEMRSPSKQPPPPRKQRSNFLSPNRSMGARTKLQNALKQKQRVQGNRWLARELGYKTEEDHLKDCQTAALQKRDLVIKLEQERLKANERKQLKERLLLQEDEDPPEEDSPKVPEQEEEEDEELILAKEIEAQTKSIAQQDDNESKAPEDDTQLQPFETQPALMVDSVPDETEDPHVLDAKSANEKAPSSEQTEDQHVSDTQSGNERVPSRKETEDSHVSDTPPVNEKASSRSGQNQTDGSDDSADSATQELQITKAVNTQEESVVTPDKTEAKGKDDNDDEELEFEGNDMEVEDRPRNAGWKAMLQKEAERLKQRKKRKGGLVEEEAEEEEEEEIAGLEDFGFSISKRKTKGDDDDDNIDEELDEDDLQHVVDDVSDNEGDEDAGRIARKEQEQREEKFRHKEMMRRMREGYDGRRGGIAGGGSGARGMHRFDQLVAADNREDAKRLGLLNDDEMDSEDEGDGKKKDDEEEDETALLDKMLKDRFMHRSDVDLEENFSEDEEEDEAGVEEETAQDGATVDEDVKRQERLAKRFTKRARMQRLEEMYGESQEFSRQRLIDEDASMKEDLSQMRCGLVRRSSSLSRRTSLSSSSSSNLSNSQFGGPFSRKRNRSNESSTSSTGGSMFRKTTGSLSIALRANNKRKSSFLGGSKASGTKETGGSYKALSLGHVLFNSQNSKSGMESHGKTVTDHKRKRESSSLFSKVSGIGKNR